MGPCSIMEIGYNGKLKTNWKKMNTKWKKKWRLTEEKWRLTEKDED